MDDALKAYIALLVLAIAAGATITLAGGPMGASIIVDIAIIAYALLLTSDPIDRHVVLAVAVGAHTAAILLYYSHPLILPFVVLERGKHGTTLDIDLVQILLAYEVIFERNTWRKLLKGLERETKESRGSEEAAVV